MKIGAIIQARISSNRFPAKVLYKINGKPMLQYLLERMERCNHLDGIVVATSRESSDTPIVEFCKELGITYYLGPLSDVAGRFREALDKYGYDGFVRITADTPLLDQRLIDKAVKIFRQGDFDIVTNVLRRTYPAGQSVEVFNSLIFIDGYRLMHDPEDLEHVTRFFYRNYKKFKVFNFVSKEDFSRINLSVDTSEDMNKITSIINCMNKPHWQYNLQGILGIYQRLKVNH